MALVWLVGVGIGVLSTVLWAALRMAGRGEE